MKRLIIISSVLLLLGSIFSGCKKFFEEDLTGKVIGNTAVDNQVGLESVLTGAYKGLGQTWTMGFLHGPQAHVTLGGDDRTGPVTDQAGREFDLFTVSASNTILKELYRGCYKTIQGTNNIISNYATASGDPAKLKMIAGEAYFLRGFAYYWLARLFKNIPLMTSTDFSLDLLKIQKTDVRQIYSQVIEDLSQAESLLGDTKRDPGRPNAGTAKAFLADVYLTMGGWPVNDPSKYALAAEKAKEVIDNQSKYGFRFLPTYSEIFENNETKNGTAEDVFAVTANKLGSGSSNTMYGLREMPGELGGWDVLYAEINFFKQFPEGERKDVTFSATVTKADGTVLGWESLVVKHPFFKKFWPMRGLPGYPLTNLSLPVVMMRYSHVLTIYAEAKARSGSPDDLAYKCLNDVRVRGSEDPFTIGSLSASAFADSVVQERAWEFAGEYTRWFDLVRLKMVKEANSHRDPLEPVRVIDSPMDTSVYVFPIPLDDQLINPNL